MSQRRPRSDDAAAGVASPAVTDERPDERLDVEPLLDPALDEPELADDEVTATPDGEPDALDAVVADAPDEPLATLTESDDEPGLDAGGRARERAPAFAEAQLDATRLYLSEIGFSPLLTAEEEVHFARLALRVPFGRNRLGERLGRRGKRLACRRAHRPPV